MKELAEQLTEEATKRLREAMDQQYPYMKAVTQGKIMPIKTEVYFTFGIECEGHDCMVWAALVENDGLVLMSAPQILPKGEAR